MGFVATRPKLRAVFIGHARRVVSYGISEQHRFRRACYSAQSRHGLCCSLTPKGDLWYLQSKGCVHLNQWQYGGPEGTFSLDGVQYNTYLKGTIKSKEVVFPVQTASVQDCMAYLCNRIVRIENTSSQNELGLLIKKMVKPQVLK